MSQYQITHSRKDGPDADHRIDAVMIEGRIYTIDDVIAWIEKYGHRFYTYVNGMTAWVHVVRRFGSKAFITTSQDGYGPNNLLNLPNC